MIRTLSSTRRVLAPFFRLKSLAPPFVWPRSWPLDIGLRSTHIGNVSNALGNLGRRASSCKVNLPDARDLVAHFRPGQRLEGYGRLPRVRFGAWVGNSSPVKRSMSAAACVIAAISGAAQAQDQTLLLRDPALSSSHIAF